MEKVINSLSPRDALLLQQLDADYENDTTTLARELGESRARLLVALQNLRERGLVTFVNYYDDIAVRLSRRGRHVVRTIWPESAMVGV